MGFLLYAHRAVDNFVDEEMPCSGVRPTAWPALHAGVSSHNKYINKNNKLPINVGGEGWF
jgi:hypothetical protein